MKKVTRSNFFILMLIGVSFQSAHSQNGNYNLGARSAAMGESSVSISDHWAVFNNVAGIAEIKAPSALFSYQNKYAISALSTFGAAFIQPLSFGTAGISAYRFGDDLFSEQKLSLSFADKIGFVSLGTTLNYVQFRIEGIGSKGLISIDFGGVVSFGERFFFGAYISNINQARIVSFENENLPTIMKVGFSYLPVDGLMLNAEIEKDLDFKERFKTGVEYKFYKQFYARTGFHTQPFSASFGLGFRPKKITIDYTFSNNPNLGDIHELSVAYLFQKKP